MQYSLESNTHIDDLVQDSSNYIANALELLQSCTEPFDTQRFFSIITL